MIKKILTILIIGLGVINFSSAIDFTSAGNNTYWSGDINTEYLHGGYTYNISNNLNFNTSISFLEGNLFYLEYISYIPAFFSIAWVNNDLYFVSRRGTTNIQGTLNNWYVGPVYERTNDSWYLYGKTFDIPTSTIIQSRPDFKEYFFGSMGMTNDWVENDRAYYICFSDLVNDYCVACNIASCPSGINTGNSLGISTFNFDTLSAIGWDNSPFISSPGGGLDIVGIELGSTESAINYYEKAYGRDESICYVGVDNYTDLYGTRVSFEEGSGLNIFQVFSGLYGDSDLNKVYVWLNSWLINYEEWSIKYQMNGLNPTYFASYNSGTNQVDLIYTGLDTSPFVNNPVAVYFMANNIYDKSPYSTMGSSVVSYCNIKLNEGTFEDIIDQSDKNNITDYTQQSNKNEGLNPDGTVNYIDFSNFGVRTGDSFLSSGVEIAFSGNTSVKNTLKNFFDQFDGALSGIDITTTTRILPTWLVTAFLFVVLFKFLRKRS